MSMPPMGVARGVAPPIMGVAPMPGVAPPIMPGPAGVSSQRDLPRLLPGVAATAGVSPGAHPGVALASACMKSVTVKLNRKGLQTSVASP